MTPEQTPKLGVVGSREYKYDIKHFLYSFFQKYGVATLVSGGARGVDTDAEEYAIAQGIPTIIHKPEWDKYGKSAAYHRNSLIVQDSDVVMAFWDGKSRGTFMTLSICQEQNKPVILIVNNEILSFGDYAI